MSSIKKILVQILMERNIYFDAVFIVIHGTPGEDGKFQSYLDKLKIPYTTSGSAASALSFNKGKCNDYLRENGVLCAPSYLLHKETIINENDILNKLVFLVLLSQTKTEAALE